MPLEIVIPDSLADGLEQLRVETNVPDIKTVVQDALVLYAMLIEMDKKDGLYIRTLEGKEFPLFLKGKPQ
jgi:hypothetical protein